MSNDPTGILRIYGQALPHAEAFIVGNRAGLIALRNAIDRALTSDEPEVAQTFAADGEGYNPFVIPKGGEWGSKEWKTMQLPYASGHYIGLSGGTAPYMLVAEDRRRELTSPRQGQP